MTTQLLPSRSLIRVVGAVVALVVVVASCGADESGGDSWPDRGVESVADDGATISSADVVGDGPTVVNLWATWCVPCRREMPMLQELADAGTKVVGVNIGDDATSVASFLDELGIDFTNVIDSDGRLMSDLDIASVPATLVVDDGDIVWRNLGEVSREALEQQLTRLGG